MQFIVNVNFVTYTDHSLSIHFTGYLFYPKTNLLYNISCWNLSINIDCPAPMYSEISSFSISLEIIQFRNASPLSIESHIFFTKHFNLSAVLFFFMLLNPSRCHSSLSAVISCSWSFINRRLRTITTRSDRCSLTVAVRHIGQKRDSRKVIQS